jgi:hypothetical protein
MDGAKLKDGGKWQPLILTQIECRPSKKTVTEEVNYLIYWRISHVATTASMIFSLGYEGNEEELIL